MTDIIKAFITGGIICVIAQLLIDYTKITPARIMVLFVVTGVVLGVLGIYPAIVEFGQAGATIPLTGFGNTLAKGVIKACERDRADRCADWRSESCLRRDKLSHYLWLYHGNRFKT